MGRREQLDRLKMHFAPRTDGEPLHRRYFLLYGMGGIGKTQICLKFLEEMSDKYVSCFLKNVVIWFSSIVQIFSHILD